MLIATVSAQKSEIYANDLEAFNKAILLYNNKQYLSAKIIFEKVKLEKHSKEVQSDCAFYSSVCAIKLNQSNADLLMENFISENPTSAKLNIAYLEIAQHR
jgi:hypothetical protein